MNNCTLQVRLTENDLDLLDIIIKSWSANHRVDYNKSNIIRTIIRLESQRIILEKTVIVNNKDIDYNVVTYFNGKKI